MKTRLSKWTAPALIALSCGVVGTSFAAAPAATTAADAITGVVTGPKGPEAGVWVIAETTDLPTRLIKIVVTDDQGRYALPELPKAKYKVWVRGYGLVDSKPVEGATGGQRVNLTAVVAPNAKVAAEYYPANYWFSMIRPPADSEFPGTGAKGNGIPTTVRSKQHWFAEMREECGHCHQVGNKVTREITDNSVEGWAERISKARAPGDQAIGNRGTTAAAGMKNVFSSLGYNVMLNMMADWSKRIAAGELPKETPPRPKGIERNVVLTVWDWGNGRFVHDTSATDRRNPTLNGYGPVYSSGVFTGAYEVLDMKKNEAREIAYGVTLNKAGDLEGMNSEHDINLGPHNTMLDKKGRVWASDRGPAPSKTITKPAFCTDGNINPYAKYFPKPGGGAAIAVVHDPKLGEDPDKLEGVPLCYGVHHLGFAPDETLFFTGPGGDVVGWLDVNKWDATKDAGKSQGWCPMVLDTNGDGKIDPNRANWNQPRAIGAGTDYESAGKSVTTVDPSKDTRILGGQYGMEANNKDGSVWYTQNDPYGSPVIRFVRGTNPPETCMTEKFQPPQKANGDYVAWGARGGSTDTKGIYWSAMANGQVGRFERAKCKTLRGPTATGQHCPEGWSFYDLPGPRVENSGNMQADWNYLTWVDQYNTSGFGDDVVVFPGTWSDSMLVFKPDTKETITMRVPYPMGAYARGVDGRIDDPKAGWKGRGLWTTYGMYTVWHQEGGEEGIGPQIVRFQVRPTPLDQ
jgi:hypothetical protein